MKPITAQQSGALALALALAACVPPPRPAPPAQVRPAPVPSSAPAPVNAAAPASWLDFPQTPGDWAYRPGSGFTVAAFGPSASEPRFALRCNLSTRQVSLVRQGPAASPTLRIVTETRTATLPAQPAPGETAALVATLPGGDRLLDAMALSKGRIAVETAGAPTLYLPSWAEVSRVIEDCR